MSTCTVAEARELWCPFARVDSENGSSFNRWESGSIQRLKGNDPRCIGHLCMAWRWSQHQPDYRKFPCDDKHAVKEPDRPKNLPTTWDFLPADPDEGFEACWMETDEELGGRFRGYCGLVGEPKA